ncbi:MAG: thiamine diphosphokinase [Pseudomonadota bacterium]
MTLIGGGTCTERDLRISLSIARTCVAADSGADFALAQGVTPTLVVGDMDSISDQGRRQIPADRLWQIAEQDSTDFDKALRHVRAPLVLAIGFLGGQIDHELAALNTVARRSAEPIVLLGGDDLAFLCPADLSLPLEAGTRVSLFPIMPVTGQSKGLKWPIDGLDFAPGARVGTSNRATGPVRLQMDGPGMLCILPRRFIQLVVSSLIALPGHARWSAPAE